MVKIRGRPPRSALRRAVELGKVYVRGVLASAQTSRRRFFIFAQGRSGSKLLLKLLASHPDIGYDREIFKPHALRPFPQVFAEGMSTYSEAPVYGFKVKIYQLTSGPARTNPESFVNGMHTRGWKIVHLWRRNVVRQSLSSEIGRQKNLWHADAHTRDQVTQKVSIDPQLLMRKMRHREQCLVRERRILQNLPHTGVNYEDDLLDPQQWQRTTARVFDFLDLPDAPTDVAMKRTSTDDLEEIISNYDEVCETLEQSKYGHFT